MKKYEIPKVDLTNFDKAEGSLKAKYGLPSEIKFCKKCVISNQRPNSAVEFNHTIDSKKEVIAFDDEGVCAACRQHEVKSTINWDDREKELIELCNKYRKNDGSYDCLVPGSGGKDSAYQAHILKFKYGMNPLTVTWAPHLYTDWGWKNFQSWIHSGLDNQLLTPNGRMHRLITRLAVENIFHPFQPFMVGQKAMAPKIATMMDIPLVFYGENEAEYGNPIADNASPKRDYAYFSSDDKSKIYLGGVSVQDLKDNFGVSDNDLSVYMPEDPARLEEKQIQVHYLGYYLPWHPQEVYYYAVKNTGFRAAPERTTGTYSKYNSIDDKIDDLHYYTTLIKFGIGRASYDASQEIRNNDIERDEGVALVKKFEHEFPERFIDELLAYLSLPAEEFPEASKMFDSPILDRDYFMALSDKFRSPHLWKRENNDWALRYSVFDE